MITAALAVTVAVSSPLEVMVARLSAVALAVLLALCGMELLARAVRRRALAPKSPVIPSWLLQAMGLPPNTPRWQPDVHFDAIDDVPEAGRGSSMRRHRPPVRAVALRWLERVAERLGAPVAVTDPGIIRAPTSTGHAGRPADAVRAAARAAADRTTGIAFRVARVPEAWVRGRETDHLGTLAARVQEEALYRVLSACDGATSAVNLHVAWGERWLGRPVDW